MILRVNKFLKALLVLAFISTSHCSLLSEFKGLPDQEKIFSELDNLVLLGQGKGDSLERPKIIAISPGTDERNVVTTRGIEIVFSRYMNTTETEKAISLTANGGNINTEFFWPLENTLHMRFRTGLTEGKRYSLRLNRELAQDKEGNSLATDYLSHFYTVGASGLPYVVSSNPPASQTITTGWPVTQNITVRFSEPMDRAETGDAVTLSGGPAVFIKTWNADSTELTFDLINDLEPSTTYTLKVGAAAKSQTGLSMEREYVVLFHTGTDSLRPDLFSITTPSVPVPWPQSPSPAINYQAGISKKDTIILTFSEAMDRDSVIQGISFNPSISGQYNWLTSTILEFTPDAWLTQNTTYRLNIANTALDSAGLPLANSYIADFVVNNTLDSVPVSIQSIVGQESPNLNVPVPPSPSTEYAINYTPPQYTFAVTFNTAGNAALQTSGSSDIYQQFTIDYLSGSDPTPPTIDIIEYNPAVSPPTVYIRISNINTNIRYLFTIKGGTTGVKDVNDNFMEKDVQFIFYSP